MDAAPPTLPVRLPDPLLASALGAGWWPRPKAVPSDPRWGTAFPQRSGPRRTGRRAAAVTASTGASELLLDDVGLAVVAGVEPDHPERHQALLPPGESQRSTS